jgi:hypothetical protein
MSSIESFGYTPQPSPYEDGISNRARRALRGPSESERRAQARAAQDASGMRIRIWRPITNQLAFKSELEVWRKPEYGRTALRKNLGNGLSLTVFDTNQQPLRYGESYTEETLTEKLRCSHPGLFATLGPIAVSGAESFGSKEKPFIALSFEPSGLNTERIAVRDAIAPELWLDSSHQLEHRPHVSLGQVLVSSVAEEIRVQLLPVLPTHVEFGPARVEVTAR